MLARVEVGWDAISLVKHLPELVPDIRVLTLVEYRPTPSLSERLVSDPAAKGVVEAADTLRIRTENALPYWDAVLTAAWASASFETFVVEALEHTPGATRVTQMTIEELREGGLDRAVDSLSDEFVLGLGSLCVVADGASAHLPLMDFRMLPRLQDVDKLKMALHTLGQRRGAILHSGRSYHYYGFELMTRDAWIEFCAKCLLLSPLTDVRFIGHRILAGSAALRLTRSTRKPHVPTIVAAL